MRIGWKKCAEKSVIGISKDVIHLDSVQAVNGAVFSMISGLREMNPR